MLTVRELQRDAERFFHSLDVRHDGEIDPEDITRYENEIAPEVQVTAMNQSGGGWHGQGGSGHGRLGDHHRSGDNGGGSFGSRLEGGARYSLLNIPEPLASADADFNRGVSLSEFEHAAGQRFVLLDSKRDGKLTLPELQMIAQATAASRRHRHERPSSDSETIGDHPGEIGQSGPGEEFPNDSR